MSTDYLNSVRKQFEYYKSLGDNTFNQLEDIDLFHQINGSNSISIIVKHLWGNMLSRWTDFTTSDGEKSWRDREAEFQSTIETRSEMLSKWEEGWTCLFNALDLISPGDLDDVIYIRNQGHSIVEAINRQLSHYSYHVGQIVLLGTLSKGSDWQSLSIPKGKSVAYNKAKFDQPKHKQHFTDEYLK